MEVSVLNPVTQSLCEQGDIQAIPLTNCPNTDRSRDRLVHDFLKGKIKRADIGVVKGLVTLAHGCPLIRKEIPEFTLACVRWHRHATCIFSCQRVPEEGEIVIGWVNVPYLLVVPSINDRTG